MIVLRISSIEWKTTVLIFYLEGLTYLIVKLDLPFKDALEVSYKIFFLNYFSIMRQPPQSV